MTISITLLKIFYTQRCINDCLFLNDLQDKGYVTTYFTLLIVLCYHMFWKILIGPVQHKVSLPFIIYLLEYSCFAIKIFFNVRKIIIEFDQFIGY